jgi:hypothetical protein
MGNYELDPAVAPPGMRTGESGHLDAPSNGLRPIEVHLEAHRDDRRTTGHRSLFLAFPRCLSGCGKRFLVGGQTYIVIR